MSARQVTIAEPDASGSLHVTAISSIALTDRDTPFVRWLDAMLARLKAEHGCSEPVEFELPAFTDPELAETKSYPFPHLVWQPLKTRTGEVLAGMLLAREQPWTAADRQLPNREADVFGIYWQALAGRHP